MSAARKIKKVMKSRPTIEGAGVHLKRAFGHSQIPEFDPFLLLDDFHSSEPEHYRKGFPWHPHRGIETITYMLEGEVAHGDNMHNQGVIAPGDVQWMTAGSGVIHQEMPAGDEKGRMWGFQLWANLPARDKMTAPRYREVPAAFIPEVQDAGGARIKVICGRVGGAAGPVEGIAIGPEYLDVTLPAGAQLEHPVAPGRNAFAYVISGRGLFCRERDPFGYEMMGAGWWETERGPLIGAETLVHFEDGETVVVAAEEEPVRLLMISGQPLGETIAWYGPIVMNTQQELEQAFREYQDGSFIKTTGSSG